MTVDIAEDDLSHMRTEAPLLAPIFRSDGQARLPHDIDVMVLGEPDVDAVYEACARVEAAVHRPVNPTILTLRSLRRRPGSWTTSVAGRRSP
ncbi:hypothetical protein GCM10009562_18380 [Nocardioides aquaticus]